jgi:hypothetical protein
VSSPLRGEAAAGDLTAGELTGGEIRAVSASPASMWLTCGVRLPHGPACLSPLARACTLHRVHLAFQWLMFKRNLKMISRKDVNGLEIHNLLILAPKIVKKILVDFLGPDL